MRFSEHFTGMSPSPVVLMTFERHSGVRGIIALDA
jgi:hypothetical protein